jgi:hypothetical protein
MTAALCRRGLVAVMLVAASASAAHGQDDEPTRSYRHLGVGSVAFLASAQPALLAGYLFQASLATDRVETDEFGVPTVYPPHWYGHALVTAGWSFDTDGNGEDGPAALGQLGLVRRLDRERFTVNRVGVAAQGSLEPEGYGAVARLGALHGNAAVSLGWMRFPDLDEDRFVASVELLRCILQDLGLVRTCVFP